MGKNQENRLDPLMFQLQRSSILKPDQNSRKKKRWMVLVWRSQRLFSLSLVCPLWWCAFQTLEWSLFCATLEYSRGAILLQWVWVMFWKSWGIQLPAARNMISTTYLLTLMPSLTVMFPVTKIWQPQTAPLVLALLRATCWERVKWELGVVRCSMTVQLGTSNTHLMIKRRLFSFKPSKHMRSLLFNGSHPTSVCVLNPISSLWIALISLPCKLCLFVLSGRDSGSCFSLFLFQL